MRALRDGVELLGGEPIDEELTNGCNVTRCSCLDLAPAARGRLHEGSAPVRPARHLLDEPTIHHAADVVRQPALLPTEQVGKLEEAQSPVGLVGEGDEDLVVRVGQHRVGGEPARQLDGQLGVHAEESAPGGFLTLVQPPGPTHEVDDSEE